MTPESVIALGQGALEIIIVIISIILLPALAIGLMVSMFQAATQINEQTLSFIPKLFVVFFVMIFAGSWMVNLVVNYTEQLIMNIPYLIG